MNNLNQWALDLRNCTPAQLMNLRGHLLKNGQAIFADTEAELLRGKIDILYPVLAFYDHDQEWLSYELEELEDRTEINYEEFLKLFTKEGEVVYSIDFNGNVMAGLKIVNGEIEVVGAVNGWGDNIPISDIRVTKVINSK